MIIFFFNSDGLTPNTPRKTHITSYFKLLQHDDINEQVNYIISLTSSSNGITIIFVNKSFQPKLRRYFLKLYLQPIGAKLVTDYFCVRFKTNFKLISIVNSDDNECFLYILKYAVFYHLHGSSTEPEEIFIKSDHQEPIYEYISLTYACLKDQKYMYYITTTDFVKCLTINRRNHKKTCATVSPLSYDNFCSTYVFNNFVYSISTHGVFRSEIGSPLSLLLSVESKDFKNSEDSKNFKDFLEQVKNHRTSLNCNETSSTIEHTTSCGIEKQSFPLCYNERKGNEYMNGGPLIINKEINNKLYMICLSKQYCFLLTPGRRSKGIKIFIPPKEKDDHFINYIIGYGIIFILTTKKVFLFNTDNEQFALMNTNSFNIEKCTSIEERPFPINKCGISTIDTTSLSIQYLFINPSFYERNWTPLTNYILLSHYYFPTSITNKHFHINFSNPTSLQVTHSLIFSVILQLIERNLPPEHVHFLMTTSCSGESIEDKAFPENEDELANFGYLPLLGIGLSAQQKVFETMFFNGCLNKVIGYVGLEKDEAHCASNVEFFYEFSFEYIIQFVRIGMLQFSVSEATTILNSLLKEGESRNDPTYRLKEKLFYARCSSTNETEYYQMLTAMGLAEVNKQVTYAQPGSKHFDAVEETPEILYLRRYKEQTESLKQTPSQKHYKLFPFPFNFH
ncbi:Uncharacterized protein QTN25_004861 [Entamoeba marina]